MKHLYCFLSARYGACAATILYCPLVFKNVSDFFFQCLKVTIPKIAGCNPGPQFNGMKGFVHCWHKMVVVSRTAAVQKKCREVGRREKKKKWDWINTSNIGSCPCGTGQTAVPEPECKLQFHIYVLMNDFFFLSLKIIKLEEKEKLVGERIYEEGSCHWSI